MRHAQFVEHGEVALVALGLRRVAEGDDQPLLAAGIFDGDLVSQQHRCNRANIRRAAPCCASRLMYWSRLEARHIRQRNWLMATSGIRLTISGACLAKIHDAALPTRPGKAHGEDSAGEICAALA
jgi:hypothetical protein